MRRRKSHGMADAAVGSRPVLSRRLVARSRTGDADHAVGAAGFDRRSGHGDQWTMAGDRVVSRRLRRLSFDHVWSLSADPTYGRHGVAIPPDGLSLAIRLDELGRSAGVVPSR